MGVYNCSMFCCTLLYVHSSIAIILMGKRELAALLNLSLWCLVMVEWLFLAVPWGCLRFVIAVFSDHTHYFLYLLCLCARLFICALSSPAGKGLTSWFSFVVYNCEFVTFPLVSWVRYGTHLYQFLTSAPLITFKHSLKTSIQI